MKNFKVLKVRYLLINRIEINKYMKQKCETYILPLKFRVFELYHNINYISTVIFFPLITILRERKIEFALDKFKSRIRISH